ncbi:hypothetical protein ACQEVY_07870 [Streptomyces sp. CA-288835]|uniref:hypothetical protein n=1 Tax=Streptomyces sp. CA-288835 TaxID=3240069 RepID=UPI003D8BBF25
MHEFHFSAALPYARTPDVEEAAQFPPAVPTGAYRFYGFYGFYGFRFCGFYGYRRFYGLARPVAPAAPFLAGRAAAPADQAQW